MNQLSTAVRKMSALNHGEVSVTANGVDWRLSASTGEAFEGKEIAQLREILELFDAVEVSVDTEAIVTLKLTKEGNECFR